MWVHTMSVDYFKPYYVCEIKVTHFPAITGIYLVMSGINLSVKKKSKEIVSFKPLGKCIKWNLYVYSMGLF
jgi:hypothetical protein